ncbi:unnamed protein product [Miscanthus lutarioriparius]|uniref:F-box domain-containing protein n=1 Tax=Miscanthus lutarioriparius TaxID=422564 RepID=A0A811S0P6_9POAL|nr:unnamed protein product [Miscanthus lutarioriparius]
MDDLPEALLAEIVKRLTSPSDLKSLSLVSKRLYAVEGELRNSMYIGCGVFPVTVALIRLCFRYPNLCKVEFNYSGWTSNHGIQLDKHGLQVFSSCCTSLTDLTLNFCTNVDDSGLRLLVCFKKLMSLRLNTLPAITSSGLLPMVVGSKDLSALHLIGCSKDNDMVTLSNNCSNLTSISLRLTPQHNEGYVFRTSLTDDSLKALALRCCKLQSFELIFWACDESWPEIGFTEEGLVMLIQSCPIRNLMLSGAHIFDDEGMKAVSSAQFLESLELTHCIKVTNAGMRLLAHCPSLINLTLCQCDRFSDAGVTEVARALKLETLVIEGCSRVSPEAVQGAATSVLYKEDYPGLYNLGRV